MTCSYRRPAEDGFPMTAPCGLTARYDGLCAIHWVHLNHLKKSRRFGTGPLLDYVSGKAQKRRISVTEYITHVPDAVRQTLYRPVVGLRAVDTACTALGLHPTYLYPTFFADLEEASR